MNFTYKTILIFLLCLCRPISQIYCQKTSEPESIRDLKLYCEKQYFSHNFKNAALALLKIASYYESKGDQAYSFDYRNKAFNCEVRYLSSEEIDSVANNLLTRYNNSAINDTILTNSIIINVLKSLDKLPSIDKSFTLLDYLSDSIPKKKDISKQAYLDIIKEKLSLAKKHRIYFQQIEAYNRILNTKIPTSDYVSYSIDLADFLFENRDYQFSNIILFNTLSISEISLDQKAKIYNILGNNFLYLNNNKASKFFYDESLKRRIILPDNDKFLRVIYNNLANYYSTTGNLDSCLIFNTLAQKISKQESQGYTRDFAFDLNNRGNYFLSYNRIDSARYYFKKSLDVKLSDKNYSENDIIHNY